MQADHIALIHRLLGACESIGMPVWLESGWAIDARLGRVTRVHEDIDLAIPAERMDDFKSLLHAQGAGDIEATDYGFLVHVNGILLDCEPCHWSGAAYELEDTPAGSCPDEKQGLLAGVPVRCTSWQAVLWEYFGYLQDVPCDNWPHKDKQSYLFVRQIVGQAQADAWHGLFRAQQGDRAG